MPISIFHEETAGIFNRFIHPWSGQRDTGGAQNYMFYNGRDIDVVEGTIRSAAAPGVGNTWRMYVFTGHDTTQKGSAVDLSGASQDVRSAIGGLWQASTTQSLTLDTGGRGVCTKIQAGSPPAGTDVQWCFLYEDALDNKISYYGFGDRLFNLLSGVGAGASRYTTFGIGQNVSSAVSGVQIPWPATGTFQYVTFVYGKSGGNDVTMVLQVDGIDTAISFTLPDLGGAGALVHDSALTASVNEGQLVNWRLQQGSPVAGTFICTLICGFHR